LYCRVVVHIVKMIARYYCSYWRTILI